MQAFGGVFLLLLMLPHGITWSEGTWVKVQKWFMGSQLEHEEDDLVGVLWGIPDVQTGAGRLLTYTIPLRAFTGPVSEFQVHEVGHQNLPVWLEFDQTSQTFQGVPTSSDLGLVHIEVTAHSDSGPRTQIDSATSTFYIKIVSDVNSYISYRQGVNQLPKGCELSDHIIKAHIILNVELKSLLANNRISLLNRLARFLSLRVSEINLGPQMKDSAFKLMDETVLMAGPGDGIDSRIYERTTLSWLLGCEEIREYSAFASVIEHNIQGGRLLQELGHSSQGWYVTVTKRNSLGGSRLNRQKRQAHGGRTLVPTPTVISAVPSKITTHLSQVSKSFTITQSSWSDIVPSRTLPTSHLTMIHSEVQTLTEVSTREVSSSLISSSEIPGENSRSAIKSNTELYADSIATHPVMDSSESIFSTLSPSFLSDMFTEMLSTKTPGSSNIFSTITPSFVDSLHSEISTTSTSAGTSFLVTDSEIPSISYTVSNKEQPATMASGMASTIQPTRPIFSTSLIDETDSPAVPDSSFMDQNVSSFTIASTILITGSPVSPAEFLTSIETANIDLGRTLSSFGSMNTQRVHPSDSTLSTYADTLTGSVEMLSSVVTEYPKSMSDTDSGKITSIATTNFFVTSSLKLEDSILLSVFSTSVHSFNEKTSFLPGSQRVTEKTSPSLSTGLQTSLHAVSPSLEVTKNLIGSLPSDTLLQSMTSTDDIPFSTELPSSTLQETSDETFPFSTMVQSLPESTSEILPSSTVQHTVPQTSSDILLLSTVLLSLSETSIETLPSNTIQQTLSEASSIIKPSSAVLQPSTSLDVFHSANTVLQTSHKENSVFLPSVSPSSVYVSASTLFITPTLKDVDKSLTLTQNEVSTMAVTYPLTVITSGFIPTLNRLSVIPTVSSVSSQVNVSTSHVETVIITRIKRTVLVEDVITSSIDETQNVTSTEIKDTNKATTKVPAMSSTGVPVSVATISSVLAYTVFSSSWDMLQTQPPIVPLSSTSSSLLSPPEHTLMASQVDVETSVDTTSILSSVRIEKTALLSSFATSSFVTSAAINSSLEPAVLTTADQVTATHDIEYSTTMAQTPDFTSVTARPTTPLIPTDPPNQAPVLVNPIGQINIKLGKYSQVKIPKGTFIDPDESIMGSLKLMLFTDGGEKLPPDSWVQFNGSTNVIHFLPIGQSIPADKQGLVLVAQDLGGLSASEYIRINFDTSEVLNVSHSFIIKMTTNFAVFSSSIFNAVSFMTVLSNYFGQNSTEDMVVTALSNGSTVFTYSNTTLSKTSCDNETILYLFSKLSDEGSGVNPEFAKYVFPEYSISSVKLKWQGACVDTEGLVVPPVGLIVNETSLASVLVPVLIILFIIPLILIFLVYVYKRRKQKGRYLPEDEKPIILRNRHSGIFNEGMRQDENRMKPMHYVDITESLQLDETTSEQSSPKTSSESLPPYRLPEYANGHHQNKEFSRKNPKKRQENGTSASHKPPPAYRLPPLYIPPSKSSQI